MPHDEVIAIAVNLSIGAAKRQRSREISPVRGVSLCCSFEWFIHASCPKTMKETVRPDASTGPSKVNFVVVLPVTLN